MSCVGIDPAGLAALGRLLEHCAAQVGGAGRLARAPLQRHRRGGAADRIGIQLAGTAARLQALAADFGWRIDALRRADFPRRVQPAPGVPVEPAILALALEPGSSPSDRTAPPDRARLLELASLAPEEVAGRFARMPEEEVNLLVAAFPELVAALDGAPPRARYAACDILIAARRQALLRKRARVRDALETGPMLWLLRRTYAGLLERITTEITELERWLAEDRQILRFDPAGDGRVVEVFGDLETAQHIGVVVPGMSNDRSNFGDVDGGFRNQARRLHDRAATLGYEDVATVAWLGYDTPDGVDAVLRSAAEAGHDDLIGLVAGLDALGRRRHITVIGHSYGSLVTGLAASAGLAADEVVFVGSPGTGLADASAAELEPGGTVWAGLADGDPIGAGVDLSEFITPRQQLSQTVRRLLDLISGEAAVRDLHHGTNPAHEDFGAIEIATEGSTGHSEYFAPGTVTLDNLVHIIAGRNGGVVTAAGDVGPLAPGPLGQRSPPLIAYPAR